MSEQLELQGEEREALQSIYEGDKNFIEVNETTFQYKYGEEDDYKSFLVELHWGENYPAELPEINMDTFYNRNVISSVKAKIQSAIREEAEQWIGCGMTYTLFECLKDNKETLTADQPSSIQVPTIELQNAVGAIKISDDSNTDGKKKEPKKEHLSKAQKRRQWERTDHKGDRPRGWDWVDIVKHLSQTGGKENTIVTSLISNGAADLNSINS